MTEKRIENGKSTHSMAVGQTRNRLLWLVALVSITFFFDGCESGEPEFTLGVVPYAECSFGDLGWGKPVKLINFWIVGLALNFAVIIAGFSALQFGKSSKLVKVRRFLTWKKTWIAVVLTVAIFNSFLLIPGVWMYCVFTPTGWLLEPFGKDPPILVTRFAGRFLFVAWTLVLTGVVYGLASLYSRYVLVDEKRWWQVRLSGLFVIMVIAGTLLGVIGRIAIQKSNANPNAGPNMYNGPKVDIIDVKID